MVYDSNIAEMPITALFPTENFDNCQNCLYYTETKSPNSDLKGEITSFNIV